jgi:peptide chain release factor 2
MNAPDFWDSPDMAQKIVSELSALKTVVNPVVQALTEIGDMRDLFELASEENDEETFLSIEGDIAEMEKACEKIELAGTLGGPNDTNDCFFSLHAGAGGTESCDWASILLRMYLRYFEANGYKYEELDVTNGEEAGIRSITLKVSGPFAFGKLSCESGVHRLVRISPFDSQSRRHTSFTACDVIPDAGDDIDIEIADGDIRIDFYRASGAGGQHVNKTSSAVRITHLATNIVVQCQNDRSQHKNKAEAMKMLKAKLYMLEQQKRDAVIASLYGNKGEIAWGNQIRSYVMQPYQMVKDHRTGYETGNVTAVLDGDIEPFIESYLRLRAEKQHK